MKKILLLSSLLIGSFFIIKPANAQIHLNVNIGVQPEWGPAGYDYAEYYYLPDIEAYYSVPQRQFIYCDRGNWIYSSSLPSRYGNYDLYSGYKVVMNERNPWLHFNDHRGLYSSFRYRHDQGIIRDGRGYGAGNYGHPNYENRNTDRGRDNRGRNNDNRGWNNDRDHRNDRSYHDRNDNQGHDRGRDNDHHDNGRGHGRGRW
jgi:hypothetical protein